jgi:hypothetical protein
MVYGVTVQTLDRIGGNGITMVFVEAPDEAAARAEAARIGEQRYRCVVLADHPIPCPGFEPTPEAVPRPDDARSTNKTSRSAS